MERLAPELPCTVRYIFEGRQGLSYARNRGIAESAGALLLFTDDDVVVHRDWVQEIVTGFATHDCMAIGGRIVAVWGQEPPPWYSNSGPYRLIGAIIEYDFGNEIQYAVSPPFGANMAFRREVFERYGLFRTDLGISGKGRLVGEDTELSLRLLKGGERIIYLPSAVIYHPVEPERVRKRYFERWYFNYGRTTIRMNPDAIVGSILYFGVPRHLFRSLGTTGLRWLASVGTRRRFYHKLQFCYHLGSITEAYGTYRNRGSPDTGE